MSTISSIASTNAAAASNQTRQKFSELIHPEAATNHSNEDGSKTIIERSVVTASDGSQVIVLTSVTINADGSRGEVRPISKMKVGKKDDNTLQPTVIDQNSLDKLSADKTKDAGEHGLVKNTAGNEYEQNSITGNYEAGILFRDSV